MRHRAVIFLLQHERFICLTNQFSGTDFLACIFVLLLLIVCLPFCHSAAPCLGLLFSRNTLTHRICCILLPLPLLLFSLILVSCVTDRTLLPHTSRVETSSHQALITPGLCLGSQKILDPSPQPPPPTRPGCSHPLCHPCSSVTLLQDDMRLMPQELQSWV